ncbi:MAG TPA: lysophospholipid acyltransferase family protein [Tepidisphaeraceae bacterium]|nr:lysophospholipid acyltransferase family protein [Tepidisphaeraceae bacterium]
MRNRIDPHNERDDFRPPKPSRLWAAALWPVHQWVMRRMHEIVDVTVTGMDRLAAIDPNDGILICPNHSYTGDGSVMAEVGRRASRPFYFMAARHTFAGHGGVDGFLLQRLGGFSVDREGCDRAAMCQANDLLTTGKALVIFPEGEIYHTNERLTPLREGVGFIALTAQRELDKRGAQDTASRRVWIVPAFIRYQFCGDVTPALDAALAEMERRLLLKPKPSMPLHERIVRYGEMALTIKEKEKLGRSFDDEGQTLPGRIARLANGILERLEVAHFGKPRSEETVPLRVKQLRRHLLGEICETGTTPEKVAEAHDALDDVHTVVQLYSYPGDYITSKPSVERMAETIEKFEEDVYDDYAKPKGKRRATVTLGEPIDVKAFTAAGAKARAAAGELTARLESAMTALMQPRL